MVLTEGLSLVFILFVEQSPGVTSELLLLLLISVTEVGGGRVEGIAVAANMKRMERFESVTHWA